MTRCLTQEERVLYAAGELPAAQRRALAEHLAVCEACRRDVRALARGLEALESLERSPALRPEAAARIERRLQEAARAAARRPAVIRLAWRMRWAAAAAAVLVAGLLLWQALGPASQAPTQTPREAIEEIAVRLELLELQDEQALAESVPATWDDEALDEIDILLDQIAADMGAPS
jgi:anti-sigma factor RsiW